MCADPLEALFNIPKNKSYWIVASSKKPKGNKYARAKVFCKGKWMFSISDLPRGHATCFSTAVNSILDKCYPDGGTHYLYFWILYQ